MFRPNLWVISLISLSLPPLLGIQLPPFCLVSPSTEVLGLPSCCFIHSLTQHIFTECLYCLSLYSLHWDCCSEQDRSSLFSHNLHRRNRTAFIPKDLTPSYLWLITIYPNCVYVNVQGFWVWSSSPTSLSHGHVLPACQTQHILDQTYLSFSHQFFLLTSLFCQCCHHFSGTRHKTSEIPQLLPFSQPQYITWFYPSSFWANAFHTCHFLFVMTAMCQVQIFISCLGHCSCSQR